MTLRNREILLVHVNPSLNQKQKVSWNVQLSRKPALIASRISATISTASPRCNTSICGSSSCVFKKTQHKKTHRIYVNEFLLTSVYRIIYAFGTHPMSGRSAKHSEKKVGKIHIARKKYKYKITQYQIHKT